MLFIDAAIVKGVGKTFSCSIQHRNETDTEFEPLDLSPYAIRFRVLGSATANAKVLVEHIITQYTDQDVDGNIFDPSNGQFSFTITAGDTEVLGIGKRPITIELLDVDTLEYVDTLTEGGETGEFNKIYIVQV